MEKVYIYFYHFFVQKRTYHFWGHQDRIPITFGPTKITFLCKIKKFFHIWIQFLGHRRTKKPKLKKTCFADPLSNGR